MKKLLIGLLSAISFNMIYGQSSPLNFESETDTDSIASLHTVSWGVMAGYNYDNLYGSDLDYIYHKSKSPFKSGFHLGVFVESKLSKHFSLQHELLFNQKEVGIWLKQENNEPYRSTMSRRYINLMPFNVTGQKGAFKIFVGPYISKLLAANQKIKNSDGTTSKDNSIYGNGDNNEEDGQYYLQKFDFGLNTGLAFNINPTLTLSARYNYGLTGIFQNANSYENIENKQGKINVYNKGIMLTLGYTIR